MKKKKNTLFQVKKWTELTYYYSVIGEEEYYSVIGDEEYSARIASFPRTLLEFHFQAASKPKVMV